MSEIDPNSPMVTASGNTVWNEQQISDWLAPLFVDAPSVRATPNAKRKAAVREPTPEQAARAEREAWNRAVELRKAEKRAQKEQADGT